MEDKTEKFLKVKEDVLNNVGVLRFSLGQCMEVGLEDPESTFYNRIENLERYIKEIYSYEELKGAIDQAKAVEMEIDAFLVSKGELTMSLTWPDF
jgi:hypothetical protein